MQGQKGVIGSSSEGLQPLEHGSNSSDSGVVESQIRWTNFIQGRPTNTNQETQNLSMWSMGDSSSTSVTNNVSHRHEPPENMLSLGDVNMNITHNHVTNGHHLLGHNVTVNPSTFIGIKPSHYASSSSSSSGPFEMESRQRPCKRKASELTLGQSSPGIINSNTFQRPRGSIDTNGQLNLVSSEPIIPRLEPGPAAEENSHRNVRIRINNSRQQDQLRVAASSSNNNININGQLNFSSPYPSLGVNPVATTGESSLSQVGQPMFRVSALRRNLQVASRNRSSSSRANRPVSSNIVAMPTNISEHPLFVPPHDIRNTAQTAINWNMNSGGGNGNVNVNVNVTNNGNGPVANLGPRHGSALYHSRRLSEVLRWSLLSSTDSGGSGGGQSSNLLSRIPPPVGASASSLQESGILPVTGITGHHLPHLRPTDRQLDGAFGFPHLARTVAGGSERRGRITSEIRNVLDLIRRGENLRLEDVMVLDQSMFYGIAGIHDRHRDMRLDIDNMSYEELLALEDRIGNVNIGLSEEKVSKCLKQKMYASVTGQPDAEPCCICQEEYKNGDDLGVLGCGHDFHTGCIKQWLVQKNVCPVCKSAASK